MKIYYLKPKHLTDHSLVKITYLNISLFILNNDQYGNRLDEHILSQLFKKNIRENIYTGSYFYI